MKKQNGYTLVETLVVLAVTAVMFAATITVVSGQIARYRFRDSVLTTNQLIRDALNDVAIGYFDVVDPNAVGCSTPDGSGTSSCVYAGKRIGIQDGKITRTSVFVDDGVTPTKTNHLNEIETPQSVLSTDMPKGVDYDNELTFYAMFDNYAGNNEGGAQPHSVRYVASGNNLLTTSDPNSADLCLSDGNRTARIIIGLNGAMSTKVEFGVPCS